MSIFFIGIIALKARLASALSLLVTASINMRGLICQEMPQRSLHYWRGQPPFNKRRPPGPPKRPNHLRSVK